MRGGLPRQGTSRIATSNPLSLVRGPSSQASKAFRMLRFLAEAERGAATWSIPGTNSPDYDTFTNTISHSGRVTVRLMVTISQTVLDIGTRRHIYRTGRSHMHHTHEPSQHYSLAVSRLRTPDESSGPTNRAHFLLHAEEVH